MKRYLYSYQTIVRFYGQVNRHFLKLRCQPFACDCQVIVDESVVLHPTDFSAVYSTDAFGNRIITGSSLTPHDSLAYISSGVVEQTEYLIPDVSPHPYYRCPSSLTEVSAEMKAFADNYASPMELCKAVLETMQYVPLSTDMRTTASVAFAQKKGVCQDFAHILIGMLRYKGFTARYVNGLIMGEGATHAWVEVHDGNNWYALDPTHGIRVVHGYIKMAHGRDANDCPVCRGSVSGMNINQQTEIRVIVNEI